MKSAILSLLGVVLLSGCPEEKKPPPSAAHAPEPIPTDFVVNSFLDNNPMTDLKVKADGGVAIPLDAAAGGPAQAAADVPRGGAPGLRVVEAGEEPRAARKYDLKQGRTESLKSIVSSTVTQEVQGQPPQSGAQPGMSFVFAITPGAKEGGDTRVKVTFTKVDAQLPPDVDPAQAKQLSQAFKALNGQAASFTLSPRGVLTNFGMADERLGRSELAQVAQQPFDGLFVAFPEEPIGKGAKWEEVNAARQEGLNATVTTTYTLKDAGPDGLVVGITTTRKAPAQPYPDPRAPKGTTMAVDGVSNATVKVRLDRAPAKSQIDSQTTITLSQPAPQGGKAKVQVQKVTVKQNTEAMTP
jgi:hypothetical protein